MKIAIDHMGFPVNAYGAEVNRGVLEQQMSQMLELANIKNVAVKASAIPTYSRERFPFRDATGYLYRLIDAFGAQRVFWGTDITRLGCSYREAVEMVRDSSEKIDKNTCDLILGDALLAWLNW